MAPKDYEIAGIDLSDDRYVVEQSLIRKKYDVLDADGDVVLRGKRKRFRMKEEFPFTDADGNDVFSVKAAGIIDVAGDYLLTDSRTGEDLVVLDNDYSVLRDTWTIRDADTRSPSTTRARSRRSRSSPPRSSSTRSRITRRRWDEREERGTRRNEYD